MPGGSFSEAKGGFSLAEPWRLTLSEGLARTAEGSLTATDWVRSLLGRIDACEGEIKAWVAVDRDGALSEAEAVDAAYVSGKKVGSLGGTPCGVKDVIDVKGLPREAGSPLLAGYTPKEDSACVARLRAAGAIVLGKTVTTPFATPNIPKTRNPWNFARAPGGSSTGSAAAVAAGMIPAALGTQTVGSILGPASFCGVVGFKPSYGRIPRSGVFALSWTFDHVGTITRSAEDAARLLTAMAGPDERDQGALDLPVPDYVAASAPRKPRRVCFLKEDFLPRCDPEVADFVERAISRVKEAGVPVEEGRLPADLDTLNTVHMIILDAEAAAYHEEMFLANPDAYPPGTREIVTSGLMVPAVHYLKALRLRARIAREMYKLFDHYGILILPTVGVVPPEADLFPKISPFPLFPTLVGLPTITLPIGRSDQNLPIGIQLVGPRFAEADLLSCGRWCEAELGWRAEIAEGPFV